MKHARNVAARIAAASLALLMLLPLASLCACSGGKETILIYSSAEGYRIADMQARLNEAFPEYDVYIEYMSTGNSAARLIAEGKSTDADIIHDMEYGYLYRMEEQGILAPLSGYDTSVYAEDTVESDRYMPVYRNGGAIIVNTERLAALGLPEPTCFEDLLDPAYKGLISMPDPKASGTGYMFLKALVNAWGEEKALAYFDKLSENVLQFTSSGAGPVNALVNNEVAIGLGMTFQAVAKISEGHPFKIIYFEEGSPYCLYGQAVVAGKEDRAAVREVFDFLVNVYTKENNDKFCPEQIFASGEAKVEGYPTDIRYCNMSNNTFEEKERLLAKWNH